MHWYQVLFICFLASCGFGADGAKILGVFPFPSKSHYAMGHTLLKELARRGHEVTMIAAYDVKNLPANISYRNIKIDVEIEMSEKDKKINVFEHGEISPYAITLFMNYAGNKIANATFNCPGVQNLLKSGEKFDAVIMDQFIDDSLSYFAHHFDAVRIALSTTCANSWVNPLVANPAPPSVNPEVLLEFPTKMTFFERLRNTFFYIYSELNRQLYFFPAQNQILKHHFPEANLYDYIYNISLVLMSAHENKKLNFFEHGEISPYAITLFMNYAGNKIANATFNCPGVQNLLKSGEKFDAVIMDQFIDDSLSYFAHHFDAVRIALSTTCANSWVNPLVANPAPPSVNPEVLLEFPTKMTFFERLRNTFFYIYSELNRQLYFFPTQNQILKHHFPKANLYDYIYNISLVLMNAHESINDPIALVPVMKNVGGMHVSPPGKLPNDLQKFMDDAKDGVIYFSMGSNLKSKDLPNKVRESILGAFRKLKAKVLWKWENETLPGQPGNVKLSQWFPQQEILAHPNLKLFITHGGLLSTIEAVYHGVPLLALPVYGDQKLNAATAQLKGYAINIPFVEFEENRFETALKELLDNPKYKQNAEERSKLFHDRPIKPMDEAIYWVEYVIRHRGAEHLKVAALKLTWYQYILLDVIAFLLVATIVVMYSLKMIVAKLCCRGGDKRTKVKSKVN